MVRVLPCLRNTAARGADRGHVDVTVARLDGQIRYQHIETFVLVLLCSGYTMGQEGQLSRFRQTLVSEWVGHAIVRVNGRISCSAVAL